VGQVAGAVVLLAATLIVLAGTWYFAVGYWLPGIVGRA
jgi:hypothetical protein